MANPLEESLLTISFDKLALAYKYSRNPLTKSILKLQRIKDYSVEFEPAIDVDDSKIKSIVDGSGALETVVMAIMYLNRSKQNK